jgi:threonine dehydrogenase-like Zn-dependent dehydrogenase
MGLAVLAAQGTPFIVDPDRSRLEKSRLFRMRAGIEASHAPGAGPWDVVVNAAPAASTVMEGISRVRNGGRFCLFSALASKEAMTVSWLNELHYREIELSGAYGCTREQMRRALGIIADHRESVERLIQERASLDRVSDALSAIWAGRVLKIVVDL